MEQWSWPLTPTEVVAIATVLLAGVTAGLALTTRRMANAARQEVAAQWRPALIPGTEEQGATSFRASTTPSIFGSHGRLFVGIYNAGSGPALNVDALLTLERPNLTRLHARPLTDSQVILAGQQRYLPFNLDSDDMDGALVVTCEDLAGVGYRATMTIHRRPAVMQVVDAEGNARPAERQRTHWFDDYVGGQPGSAGRAASSPQPPS